MKIKIKYPGRGFALGEFVDRYGASCSIQKSSAAMEDLIWLGINNAEPKIMVSDARRMGLPFTGDNGWTTYHVPSEVLMSTRMHLTRKMVKELLPLLTNFVRTGELE